MKFRALKSAEISLIHFERKETQKVKKEAKINSSKEDVEFELRLKFNIQFFREFDPGSGLTLAACITHSSRTELGASVLNLVADG